MAYPFWRMRENGLWMPAIDAFLEKLLPAARIVDAVNSWIGKRVAWLIIAAVLVSATNATVRKVFDTSSNSWLELQWILFSVVFLLVLAMDAAR